ncbi:uncharacterized protein [Watersipora subatra]|uniref:uncharacterized protein n=1 Tax=Watersipora subatra TaxID=2589382 RepID=UPI00355AF532
MVKKTVATLLKAGSLEMPIPQKNSGFFSEELPEVYPAPELREPTHTSWINPALGGKNTQRSRQTAIKRSLQKDDERHRRIKRSDIGNSLSEGYKFSLKALSPYDSDGATFKFGSIISYQCIITASDVDKDLSLEVYTDLNGGAYFMISNVRFGYVGSNLDTFIVEEKEILYYSTYKDGRYDRATIALGKVHNSLADLSDYQPSQVEILFEVQTLPHSEWVHGESYRISIAALLDSELFSVAQDAVVYDSTFDALDVASYNQFSADGPAELMIGMTDVWTVTATIHDLSSTLVLDVFTPIDLPQGMSIDRVSIASVGYLSRNYDVNDNTITFEVVITMLEHELDAENPYDITFAIWKRRESDSMEIMWTGSVPVQAVDANLPEMEISADFMTWPSTDQVAIDGFFGIAINLTIPASTITDYLVEVNVPVHEGNSIMNIESERVSKIGFNMPHLERFTDYGITKVSKDGINVDYLSMHFRNVGNIGQRDRPDDETVQIEIGLRLLNVVTSYYTLSDTLPVEVGVTHNEKIYWVDIVNVDMSEVPQSYTVEQLPSFSLANVMGRNYNITSETGGVVDLDIIIPPALSYDSMTVEFATTNTSQDMTTLKIVEVKPDHVGKSLIFRSEGVWYYGSAETEVNQDAVYNHANKIFEYLTSLKREDSPRYAYEDRTIRLRAYVVCRGRTAASLTDGEILWLLATVTLPQGYIYTARVGFTYSATAPDYYTNFDWQPDLDMRMAEGYKTNVVRRGEVLRYNIAVNLPYRTSADLYVNIESLSPQIQVCKVLREGFGKALVDYLPPNTTDAEIFYEPETHRLWKSSLNIPAVTSYSYDIYADHPPEAFANFTAIIMLDESAAINETYTFRSEVSLGQLTTVEYEPEIVTTADLPVIQERPVFKILHQTETDTINVGGSEVLYFDMYIPPATSHRYHVIVHAPWNESNYGQYTILDAFMVSAGSDLSCFNGYTTNVTILQSETVSNKAVFTTSYIANVDTAQEFVLKESDKVRLAVHVALIANTTIPTGDRIPVTFTVDMNNGADVYFDYVNLEVISPDDDRNTNPLDNMTMAITALGDRVFSTGETQHFYGLIRFPSGAAVTNLKIVIESPMVKNETMLTVAEPNITFYGNDIHETKDFIHSHNETNFLQTYSRTLDFGFVRSLGIANQSDFHEETPTEDELEFDFSLRLMDHVSLYDGKVFDFIAYIIYGDGVIVNATGDTSVTVSAPETDTTSLFWDVYSIDQTTEIVYRDTTVSFGLDIGIRGDSRRFPDNVTVFYRVPFISSLVENSMSFIGLEKEFYVTPTVNQYGLQFEFKRLRYDYQAQANFSIILDPNAYLEHGLLQRFIKVPVDVRYYEESKTSPGQFEKLFTGVNTLELELDIPDCQLSASVDDGQGTAQYARLDSAHGWATLKRGPPFYQNEYIQIDLGGQVRMTAVTIQPFKNDFDSRMTSFKLQYSWEGLRWEYLLEGGVEKVFDVVWPVNANSSTKVMVPLNELAFETRFLRLVPQSNAANSYVQKLRFDVHGCSWPYKTVLPAYSCQETVESEKSYEERQMLAVKENIFVCMISQPNDLPYCSGSNDVGLSWFAMDDNVMNMLGYDPSTEAIYALARNRWNTLRSTDMGHTWAKVEEDDFASIDAHVDYHRTTYLPFPLSGNTVFDLLELYGEETETGHTWAVSNQALHAYPGTIAEIVAAGKSTADDQVGYWGSTAWN